MMKKTFALILAGLCVVLLCACSGTGNDAPSQAVIEGKMADEAEKNIKEADVYSCNADFFSQGGSITPVQQDDASFRITYISINGSGGYDWDFSLENRGETPVTVYITAYKTEQTQENEVKSWSISAEQSSQICDIISWDQPYRVFHITIEPPDGNAVFSDFVVEYN